MIAFHVGNVTSQISIKKIVLKYGTNALTYADEYVHINKKRIAEIAQIAETLYARNIEAVLVTSGAVAAGMELNRLLERPDDDNAIGNLAAEGQIYLMASYQEALMQYNIGACQLLVSAADISRRGELIKRRIKDSFEERKLTIINANDALAAKFVDNDYLAARIAVLCNADYLIMVSEPGNLGSGGGIAKQKALKLAEKHGIKAAVMTHTELEELIQNGNN